MALPESLRRWLHAMLALLVLASGVFGALQSVQHGGEAHHHVHAIAHDALANLAQVSSENPHFLNAIDGGVDEHGHHFHVHLSAPALISITTSLAIAAIPALVPAINPLRPDSLSYAPPVPPPNV